MRLILSSKHSATHCDWLRGTRRDLFQPGSDCDATAALFFATLVMSAHSCGNPADGLTIILGKDLGRLLLVCRWKERVLVLIQRSVITARSAEHSGPNSRLAAFRVRLVAEFDVIATPDIQDTFRCACVHHDCVRSRQVNRGAICSIERAHGVLKVANCDDEHYFLNPGWHSLNTL